MADSPLQPLYDTAAAERYRLAAAWKPILDKDQAKAARAARDDALWRGILLALVAADGHPRGEGDAPPADLAPHLAAIEATLHAICAKGLSLKRGDPQLTQLEQQYNGLAGLRDWIRHRIRAAAERRAWARLAA